MLWHYEYALLLSNVNKYIYTIGHSGTFSVKTTPPKLFEETTAETKKLMQKTYAPVAWMETCLLDHTLRLNLYNNNHSVSQ